MKNMAEYRELKKELYEGMSHEFWMIFVLGVIAAVCMIYRYSVIQLIMVVAFISVGILLFKMKKSKSDELHLYVRLVFSLGSSLLCFSTNIIVLGDQEDYLSILVAVIIYFTSFILFFYYYKYKNKKDGFVEKLLADHSKESKRKAVIIGGVSAFGGGILNNIASDDISAYIHKWVLLVIGVALLDTLRLYFVKKVVSENVINTEVGGQSDENCSN